MAMSKTAPIFEIYTDRKGEFRWRARARNGNLLAAASEGYVNKRDAVHCAKLFGYDPSVVVPEPKKVAVKKAAAKKAEPEKPEAKKAKAKKAPKKAAMPELPVAVAEAIKPAKPAKARVPKAKAPKSEMAEPPKGD
jgi:uncharacterized protein